MEGGGRKAEGRRVALERRSFHLSQKNTRCQDPDVVNGSNFFVCLRPVARREPRPPTLPRPSRRVLRLLSSAVSA